MTLRILVAVYFSFQDSKGCILATFKVSADWALSNIRDFLFSCSSFIFRIARFDFYSLFHPLELFCLFFWYSLVSCVRIWFWSHIWFSSGSTSGFLDFQFHYLCLDLFPVLFGFRIRIWFWSYIWFSQGLFRVLIYCLALVEFLYRVLLQVLFPVSVLRLDFL